MKVEVGMTNQSVRDLIEIGTGQPNDFSDEVALLEACRRLARGSRLT